jgi:hypothetical protein
MLSASGTQYLRSSRADIRALQVTWISIRCMAPAIWPEGPAPKPKGQESLAQAQGLYLFSVLSQSFSSSSFVLDHTVPYGTALLGGVFPGTSCQATIAPSLRDISQRAPARCCCEMSASASRRDDTDRSLARSAWKSVHRKSRPVGYGMIGYEGRPDDQDDGAGR